MKRGPAESPKRLSELQGFGPRNRRFLQSRQLGDAENRSQIKPLTLVHGELFVTGKADFRLPV